VKVLVNLSDDQDVLKLHNVYLALHRIVKLVYPGYHVIFSKSIEGGNYVRMLLDLPEVMEGWSIYADNLMGEHGFLESLKDKFLRYLTLYRNTLLAYLDMKVNTGELTHLEALNRLVEEGYMDKNEAVAHVLKLVISPTMSLSPYFGYKKIWKLRENLRSLMGNHYSDGWFNDTFLKYAVLPLDFMKVLMVRDAALELMDHSLEDYKV
jgi:uncharacterized protein (DUF885 family)